MSGMHQMQVARMPWTERPLAQAGIGMAVFAILTAAGAEIRIPIAGTPVPVTLQTLFVLLAGAALGPAWGAASQIAYLALRAAGVPGFAGAVGGFTMLVGPTGGYLVGFVIAAAMTGWVADRGSRMSFPWLVFSMLVGTLVVYACGVAWLIVGLQLPMADAFIKGVLPFALGDVLKLVAAAGLARLGGAGMR